MKLSLDELAKAEIYKINPEYEKLFNELDKVCGPEDNKGYKCESFNSKDIHESFKPELQKIFNILKRTKEKKDIYINAKTLGNNHPCVFYKYWFFHKIINHNPEEIDFNKLKHIWNKNTMNIYSFITLDRCKFLAKTLDDIKIMKVLYDHVFFFNNEDNNYNFIERIKKCEFCNNLEMYIRKTFSNKPVKCAHASSYAICVEYNEHLNKYFNVDELSSLSCENDAKMSYCPSYSKLQEHVAREMTTVIEKKGEIMETMQDKTSAQGNPENPEGNNIADKNVIGGISVLGISCILFFLYKFTSFGSLINRRTGWITKMLKNPQENREHLLLRASETENINSENSQYNLAYTSIQDY